MILYAQGYGNTWLLMAKAMNLESSQQLGLLCFVIYLYSPKLKQNLNQFKKIHKALLFCFGVFEKKNNAVSLCIFPKPEFLKANIPNELRHELAECTPRLSRRLATIPAVCKDISSLGT